MEIEELKVGDKFKHKDDGEILIYQGNVGEIGFFIVVDKEGNRSHFFLLEELKNLGYELIKEEKTIQGFKVGKLKKPVPVWVRDPSKDKWILTYLHEVSECMLPFRCELASWLECKLLTPEELQLNYE